MNCDDQHPVDPNFTAAECYYAPYTTVQDYPGLSMTAASQWANGYALPTWVDGVYTAFTAPLGGAEGVLLADDTPSIASTTAPQHWDGDVISLTTIGSLDIIPPFFLDTSSAQGYEQPAAYHLDGKQQHDETYHPDGKQQHDETSPRFRHKQKADDRLEESSSRSKDREKKRKAATSETSRPEKKRVKKGKKDVTSKTKPSSAAAGASIPTPTSSPTSSSVAGDNILPHCASARRRDEVPPLPPSPDYDDDDEGPKPKPDSHLLTRRECNRKAAVKCRTKAKVSNTQLESDERFVSGQQVALHADAVMLRSEILALRARVLEHHSCGCVDMQNYMRNAVGFLGDTGGGNPIWGVDGSGDGPARNRHVTAPFGRHPRR